MLDYDAEAARYDATRGGRERAAAAAAAVHGLLPERLTRVLDIAGGTGSVASELAALGREVAVGDLSLGMLRVAQRRLPGSQVRLDAKRLPVADSSLDAVTSVWLLHLLPARVVEGVLDEAARVLRPGGRYVTTVDKAAGDARDSRDGLVNDRRADVTAGLEARGLTEVGSAEFVGGITREGRPAPRYTLVAFEKPATR
ncbi:class I SAM-dependent methyltransferase [Segeticoccus rhizosphaerae]|uniref:class I SAM-dependent methyltransferase n=1 Tax=Segeticoccus rhizosphaerae TaxID=1104777 RepID=UPI0010BFF1C9|nr:MULTISPECIES: class I SAM-dependent methyltransferase [Intrasporangiaceae]